MIFFKQSLFICIEANFPAESFTIYDFHNKVIYPIPTLFNLNKKLCRQQKRFQKRMSALSR